MRIHSTVDSINHLAKFRCRGDSRSTICGVARLESEAIMTDRVVFSAQI